MNKLVIKKFYFTLQFFLKGKGKCKIARLRLLGLHMGEKFGVSSSFPSYSGHILLRQHGTLDRGILVRTWTINSDRQIQTLTPNIFSQL